MHARGLPHHEGPGSARRTHHQQRFDLGARAAPGLGALYALFDLERGSHGFNTGFAFPEVLAALVRFGRAGRWDDAWGLYRRYLPLIVFEQQPGVAVRKEILRRRGLLDHATVRHPGAGLDAAVAAQLDRLLERTLPGVDLTQPLPAAALEGAA